MTNLCRAFECRKYLNSETFHKIGVGKDGGMVSAEWWQVIRSHRFLLRQAYQLLKNFEMIKR
jgi:hypothetical protein